MGTVWNCSTSRCTGAKQKKLIFEYHCRFPSPGTSSISGRCLGEHPSWRKSSFFFATRMRCTDGNPANFSCPSSNHQTTNTNRKVTWMKPARLRLTDIGRKQVHCHCYTQHSSKNILQREDKGSMEKHVQDSTRNTKHCSNSKSQSLCSFRVLHGLVQPWTSTAISQRVITRASRISGCSDSPTHTPHTSSHHTNTT